MADKQAEVPTGNGTTQNKTSLGKRKKSEASECTDDIDSAMNEQRKKIQKVTHSNTIDGELVEKMESEIMLKPSFVQNKMICGEYHTITLSDDGTVYSFGNNVEGALGLGHNKDVSLPTPIPNLPQINMISCGGFFTVCVDYEGFIWSFGENFCGQLGIGYTNRKNCNVPQKILNIPPVHYVSCGYKHTLMITNDDNLWSCGRNYYGQLCFGDKKSRSKPQKTSFSNITKISAGCDHSFFQNNKGEIFSCGFNKNGECGLGHKNHPQITPSLILNVPPNIVHFVCGGHHSLFLDGEGNVYSVGNNEDGKLGLVPNINKNVFKKIPNIPPIKIISCVDACSYLIDFEGNLWTFGKNNKGQLGNDNTDIFAPKIIINSVKYIQQISYGSCGDHFFAKSSQNQIFAIGDNGRGQLGTGDTDSVSIPKEINSQYSTIWGDEFPCRAKSARK